MLRDLRYEMKDPDKLGIHSNVQKSMTKKEPSTVDATRPRFT